MPAALVVDEKSRTVMAGLSTFALSGTVKLDSVGVRRRVLVYRNEHQDAYAVTWSDTSGNFSVTVNGSSNDRFIVLAVGQGGERCQVHSGILME